MTTRTAKKFSFNLELNQSLTPAQKDAVADSIQRLFCSYIPETEVDLKGGKITVSVTETDKFTRLKFEDAKNKLKWNRQVDLLNEKSAARERRCTGCGTDLGVIKPTTQRAYRVSGPKDSPKVETLGPYNGNRVPKDHLVSGKGSYFCPTCAADKGFIGNGGPDLTMKNSSNQSGGWYREAKETAYQPFCLDCGSFDVTPAGDAGFKCNVCGEKWVNPGFDEQDVDDFAFDLEDADDDVNLDEGDDRELGLLGKSAGKPSDWTCPYCQVSSNNDHKPNCPVSQSLNSIDGTGAPKQATNYPIKPEDDEEQGMADAESDPNRESEAFNALASTVQHFLQTGSVLKFSEGEDCPVCGLTALASDGMGNVACGGCGLSLPDPNPVDVDFAEPSCPYCGSENCEEDEEFGGHSCFDCGQAFEKESSFLA